MTFSEFEVSKIAYQAGYTNVYYNEDKEKGPTPLPNEWLIDSVVVFDFAYDNGMKVVETEEGDVFSFDSAEQETDFLFTFKTEIEAMHRNTVDELLSLMPSH